MAAPKQYGATLKGVMMWANSELEHVGRIAAVEDPDIQYSYALSTVNGMAHLKDALYELFTDDDYANHRVDIKKKHDAVIRVMKHLIREYDIDIEPIRQFNVRHVLSNLAYLEDEVERANNWNNGNNGNIPPTNHDELTNENQEEMAGGAKKYSRKRRVGVTRRSKKSTGKKSKKTRKGKGRK